MKGNIRIAVSVADQPLAFSLCRKAEQLGPLPVDHWWMPITDLYSQRGKKNQAGGNLAAVTAGFWALCRSEGTHHSSEVQESYLLACLVPFTRSQGSRRIFADAWLNPPRQHSRLAHQDSVTELERLLRSSPRGRMGRLEFQRKTGDVLGPPPPSEDSFALYKDFCRELFLPARRTLLTDEAGTVNQVIACWERWMRSIARHRGRDQDKQILDMLSYEARTSLHRCYSVTWEGLLLPHLREHYQLDSPSEKFLCLWHLDQPEESNLGEQAFFHLFHGHVFGLHPAGALLLQTHAGREIMGRWVADPSEAHWEHLLHAIYLAAYLYQMRREQNAFERCKQPKPVGDTEILDEPLASRPGRRRGSRPRTE